MAPPTKLTPKLADSIIANVKLGLFDAQNALKHGLDFTTLRSWIERGIDEEAVEPYRTFAERYVMATIALEESVITTILSAADEYVRKLEATEDFEGGGEGAPSRKVKSELVHLKGDWKAAAWYAERRWPLRWGITRQPEGGPKEMLKLPDAPLQRRKKVDAMVTSPPPELIKRLRDAGYELVRKDKAHP